MSTNDNIKDFTDTFKQVLETFNENLKQQLTDKFSNKKALTFKEEIIEMKNKYGMNIQEVKLIKQQKKLKIKKECILSLKKKLII